MRAAPSAALLLTWACPTRQICSSEGSPLSDMLPFFRDMSMQQDRAAGLMLLYVVCLSFRALCEGMLPFAGILWCRRC